MTHRFTITELRQGRYLVEGTDKRGNFGSAVLYSDSFNQAKRSEEMIKAEAEFSGSVDEFFGDLLKAAEKFEQATMWNDTARIVVREGVDPVDEVAFRLDYEGEVLLHVMSGDHDDLIWVDQTLEILA